MALSQLQSSLASINNEFSAAAASFRFDFTLVKYEAPKEYQPLGRCLPSHLKEDAEHGNMHVTAQRLGALFEEMCPSTPLLVKAYGNRVSEIAATAKDGAVTSHNSSFFAAYSGTDGASIWAAATSSTAALQIQLLACMLARVWSPHEAVSTWVEVIKERRNQIASRFARGEEVPYATLAAAKQLEVEKSYIARWDASARAWLRIADVVKENEQKKLMLILDEATLSIGKELNAYNSVLEVWKTAMVAMEQLLSGAPQATKRGAIVLGLSAWHLYPNMLVLNSQRPEMTMNDPLLSTPGAVLTIGLEHSQASSPRGVFWSLSLAHLRHYGYPVVTKGTFSRSSARLSFQQLTQATLGALLGFWGLSSDEEIMTGARIISKIRSICLSYVTGSQDPMSNHFALFRNSCHWLNLLADAARELLDEDGPDQTTVLRVIKLGQRRSGRFLGRSGLLTPPFWGFIDYATITNLLLVPEDRVQFLRHTASQILPGKDLIIRYLDGIVYRLVNVYPRHETLGKSPVAKKRRMDTPGENMGSTMENPAAFDQSISASTGHTLAGQSNFGQSQREDYRQNPWWPGTFHHFNGQQLHMIDDFNQIKRYSFLFGSFQTAAIWIYESTPTHFNQTRLVPRLEDFERSLDSKSIDVAGLISEIDEMSNQPFEIPKTLQSLAYAATVYSKLEGATLRVQTLDHPLYSASWVPTHLLKQRSLAARMNPPRDGLKHPRMSPSVLNDDFDMKLSREAVFSCVVYFESGCNIPPDWLHDVFAMSSGDSLYIDAQLLRDPSELATSHELRRILGNVGRPGITLLVPPQDPMIRKTDPEAWAVVNHHPFTGKAEDLFDRTTLHLSFTEHEFTRSGVPLEDKKAQFAHAAENQVLFLESIVSVHHDGIWQADVDILKALKSSHVFTLPAENVSHDHTSCVTSGRGLVSVQSWDEILDRPQDAFVVNAKGNWNARLAAIAVLSQIYEKMAEDNRDFSIIVVCPATICWGCAKCVFSQCTNCQRDRSIVPLKYAYHHAPIAWVQ